MSNFGIPLSAAAVISSPITITAATKINLNPNTISSQCVLTLELRAVTNNTLHVPFGSLKDTVRVHMMSALPPKADMCSATGYVRFVPKAD